MIMKLHLVQLKFDWVRTEDQGFRLCQCVGKDKSILSFDAREKYMVVLTPERSMSARL